MSLSSWYSITLFRYTITISFACHSYYHCVSRFLMCLPSAVSLAVWRIIFIRDSTDFERKESRERVIELHYAYYYLADVDSQENDRFHRLWKSKKVECINSIRGLRSSWHWCSAIVNSSLKRVFHLHQILSMPFDTILEINISMRFSCISRWSFLILISDRRCACQSWYPCCLINEYAV